MTPSSQCDNIERFCLDLIALAELLAPHDVISTSVISSQDPSGPGRPFMISLCHPSPACAVPESGGINLDPFSSGDIATSSVWFKGNLSWLRRLNKGSSRCLGSSRCAVIMLCYYIGDIIIRTIIIFQNPSSQRNLKPYSLYKEYQQQHTVYKEVYLKCSYLKTARFHCKNNLKSASLTPKLYVLLKNLSGMSIKGRRKGFSVTFYILLFLTQITTWMKVTLLFWLNNTSWKLKSLVDSRVLRRFNLQNRGCLFFFEI